MIVDKLHESVEKRGHVCLGLDTDYDYIPKEFAQGYSSEEEAIFHFNKRMIDATRDVVACYKVQIAYYECYGLKGMKAYSDTINYIRKGGSIVIADIKRGDIAKTAEMYAKAHFEGDFESDFITVNPYMGMDSLEPYLDYVKNKEKGLFVLIRTSNKGAKDIQYIKSLEGRRVYNTVGENILKLSRGFMGDLGYSSIGGVVGCTHIEEGKELRENLKGMFFLIPGYGAQGGGASEVSIYLENGNGGIVNSSRGILLAYKNYENASKNFDEHGRNEVLKMREAIKNASKI